MGCEPGCSTNPPGDVFASNFVMGGKLGVGHQGPFANNWIMDNAFVSGDIYEQYSNGSFHEVGVV